jgi:primase-polymerase (primpol)-like protein
MALCCLLAFWTGGDTSRIDSLFRDSGLMREKWDEQHYSDGSTYGEVTVERAVDITDEFFEPGHRSEESHSGERPEAKSTADARSSVRQEYEAERAQLLEQRVRELEALLKLKQERIEALELQTNRSQTAVGTSIETVEVEAERTESGGRRGLLRRLFG